jgi:TetR/AcrR family transcriptional repressor of nem operon
LLTGADSLFRDRGFGSVGVAEICKLAGVNKGSFYHFFSSKRELLLDVVESAWDETGMLRDWEREIPHRPVEHLQRYLEELFAVHYADKEANGRVRGSLIANVALELGSSEPEVGKKLDELLRRETAIFETLLVEAQDRGEVSLGNTRFAAQALVASLHGLLMLAKVRNDLSVLPDAENELLRLVGVTQPYL